MNELKKMILHSALYAVAYVILLAILFRSFVYAICNQTGL